mmetsp:Transcript_25607/g.51661  ORF Transcript_25607/g.51661 Transcript_25607/m.51661 type:complete len:160 (-) Transcript_25607:85-564(-)|eukprot:CAMPEP_0113823988 /NCGR_PEP_ID=MMETSP0328-20130328/3018_1 /TAXON_ID=39455 /ORGANISM="Alexandrium minutum" /LENGTH=159 /DNA_ID=CAMNT_0000791929 /DNA_START=58 /DNA_END=537 /DNA_ORIENTATION=- /assembly_acc=CAM_ASM_000350
MTDALALPAELAGRQLVLVLPPGVRRPAGFDGIPSATQSPAVAAKACPAEPCLIDGDIMSNSDRSLKVSVDGVVETVYLNGEEGPLWFNLASQPHNGPRGRGRWQMTETRGHGHEGTKAWSGMSKTEREILIIRVARYQQSLRRRGVHIPDLSVSIEDA